MTTITFTQNAQTGKYEATYNGESGALRVKREAVGKMFIYTDTVGDGEYLLAENGVFSNAVFATFLDMSYAKGVKMVSDSRVVECKINTDK